MAWFNLFAGPTAERLEQKGDALGESGFWGAAKLEYEAAFRRLKSAPEPDRERLSRLGNKIIGSKEALAREHHQSAVQLAAISDFKEALELVELAQGLTGDDALRETLAQQKRDIEALRNTASRRTLSALEDEQDPEEERVGVPSPDEQFRAL